jgi:hypothetical protein
LNGSSSPTVRVRFPACLCSHFCCFQASDGADAEQGQKPAAVAPRLPPPPQ